MLCLSLQSLDPRHRSLEGLQQFVGVHITTPKWFYPHLTSPNYYLSKGQATVDAGPVLHLPALVLTAWSDPFHPCSIMVWGWSVSLSIYLWNSLVNSATSQQLLGRLLPNLLWAFLILVWMWIPAPSSSRLQSEWILLTYWVSPKAWISPVKMSTIQNSTWKFPVKQNGLPWKQGPNCGQGRLYTVGS